MKLHDCDCAVVQIYFLDKNGCFNKHATFINVDRSYGEALKLIFQLNKNEVNSTTTTKKMKGCYYAD